MLPNSSLLKIVAVFILAIMLCQCAHVMEPPTQPLATKKVATAIAIPYTMPATAYLALAKNQPESEKQSMLLMAAGRFIYDGQWRDGIRTLAQTNNLSPTQNNVKTILLAKTDLMRTQPRAAVAKLANVREASSLPIFYQVQYHEILASAYESLGNASESVVERIKLDPLITDESGHTTNRRILWLTLTKLPTAELNTMAVEATENSELQGWMKLALIPRQGNSQAQDMVKRVEQWQYQYPSHPANSLLPSPLASVKASIQPTPRQIALLLPLSGPLAGPGAAIRDGFMAAASTNPTIKIQQYNTATKDAAALYQQALNEGADYVVGPLSKTEVARVAEIEHPVPTLLLNDMTVTNNTNAYRFGLSPNNEAAQVAIKANQRGYKRALVIAPAGAWGDEIVSTFSAEWKAKGGLIVDKLAYDNNDLNIAIRDLLHVTDSQAREKQIKQLLGRNIQTMPRRRQDFDMIFLLAYPSKARQIMPLLRYYFAGNVPVYATSTVYAGSPNIMKDKDLDGIIFSDMPWVFSQQMANKNWPEQLNSYNRLYALGMDSYSLATQLNQLLLFPAMGINDKSGVLYLKKQQIARIPAWGQFKGGVAVPADLS